MRGEKAAVANDDAECSHVRILGADGMRREEKMTSEPRHLGCYNFKTHRKRQGGRMRINPHFLDSDRCARGILIWGLCSG